MLVQLSKPRLTQVLTKLGIEFQAAFEEWLNQYSRGYANEEEEGATRAEGGLPPRIKAALQLVKNIREQN